MSATSGAREPRQDRARQRVEALLAAAADLLREEGLPSLTMSSVAARAGSSLPSAYRYFPDRSALLHALAERYLDEIHTAIDQQLRGLRTRDDARAALAAVLSNYFTAFAEDAALRHVWIGTVADPALNHLNVADSERNGALLADRLGPFTSLSDQTLLDRCVLASHLAHAAVTLALGLEPGYGKRLIDEFGSWAEVLLLPA